MSTSSSSRMSAQVRKTVELRCPYCHDAIRGEQTKWACVECMAWHHADCHGDHGRCASCGIEAPATKGAEDRRRVTRLSPTPVTRVVKGCMTNGCERPALNSSELDLAISQRCAVHGYDHAVGLMGLGIVLGLGALIGSLVCLGWAVGELTPEPLGGLLLTLPLGGLAGHLCRSRRVFDRIVAERRRDRRSA